MGLEQIQVELLEHMGSDASIARAAWTSSLTKSSKDKKTQEQIEVLIKDKLINWEEEEAHQTPFETVVFSFWMRHPIFNDRQQMTHRFSSQNGMSGRYRTMPTDFYEFGLEPQGICMEIEEFTELPVYDTYLQACREANDNYKELTRAAKEARDNLAISNDQYKRFRELIRGMQPQANMTERVMTLNLISFANFQRLRNSEHAQVEIRHMAKEMLRLVKEANICPIAIRCLEDLKWKVGNLVV